MYKECIPWWPPHKKGWPRWIGSYCVFIRFFGSILSFYYCEYACISQSGCAWKFQWHSHIIDACPHSCHVRPCVTSKYSNDKIYARSIDICCCKTNCLNYIPCYISCHPMTRGLHYTSEYLWQLPTSSNSLELQQHSTNKPITGNNHITHQPFLEQPGSMSWFMGILTVFLMS